MNRINFFSPDIYREPSRTDLEFGINDAAHEGDHHGMAYTTLSDKANWNATVVNSLGIPITFQPVDKNIRIVENGDERSLCDGMLFTENKDQVIFIELKDKRKDWLTECISQLKSTIELFASNYDISTIRKRDAYAANKMHPQFMYSQRILMQEFYSSTRFRLHPEAKVKVKG